MFVSLIDDGCHRDEKLKFQHVEIYAIQKKTQLIYYYLEYKKVEIQDEIKNKEEIYKYKKQQITN